jgi:hypothetical protein
MECSSICIDHWTTTITRTKTDYQKYMHTSIIYSFIILCWEQNKVMKDRPILQWENLIIQQDENERRKWVSERYREMHREKERQNRESCVINDELDSSKNCVICDNGYRQKSQQKQLCAARRYDVNRIQFTSKLDSIIYYRRCRNETVFSVGRKLWREIQRYVLNFCAAGCSSTEVRTESEWTSYFVIVSGVRSPGWSRVGRRRQQ